MSNLTYMIITVGLSAAVGVMVAVLVGAWYERRWRRLYKRLRLLAQDAVATINTEMQRTQAEAQSLEQFLAEEEGPALILCELCGYWFHPETIENHLADYHHQEPIERWPDDGSPVIVDITLTPQDFEDTRG